MIGTWKTLNLNFDHFLVKKRKKKDYCKFSSSTYFRTFVLLRKVLVLFPYENFFSHWGTWISMAFCFEALGSTKISSDAPVSSQKYENGCRTKFVTLQYSGRALRWGLCTITSWYPKFNGSHFGWPPSSIHRVSGLGAFVFHLLFALSLSLFLSPFSHVLMRHPFHFLILTSTGSSLISQFFFCSFIFCKGRNFRREFS